MSKDIKYSDDARKTMASGLEKVFKAVSATLGPRGRNIVITSKWGKPYSTRDGITVAKEISLENPVENSGAQLCIEAAGQANDNAGDGSSTATVLTRALVVEGLKHLDIGRNPVSIKRGIDKAVEVAVDWIEKNKEVISYDNKEAIEFIATISANDVEAGKTVAEAFTSVGENGVVTLEDTKNKETTIDVVEGLKVGGGTTSPHFIVDEQRMKIEVNKPLILIWEKRIAKAQEEIVPFLHKIHTSNPDTPVIILADAVEGDALATLLINYLKGITKVIPVKAPGFGDRRKYLLKDVSIFTGGTFFDEALGVKLENVSISKLGTCEKAIITRDSCTLIGGSNKEAIDEHIKNLKQQLAEADSDYDREKINERIANLCGKVAIIKLGGNSETEVKEKKFRFEDAVNATKAALEEGIVPGGGVTLVNAAQQINLTPEDVDEQIGVNIVKNALEVPLKTILLNGGFSHELITEKIKDKCNSPTLSKFGFDARKGEFCDLRERGIVDPVKVTKSALTNAASVAGVFLTTEGIIIELPEEKRERNIYNPAGLAY